jgi:capsular exopolysaccharide synthesis family protein
MLLPGKRWTRRKPRAISGRLVTISDPDSAAAEAYRILRTNLIYAYSDRPVQVITITSAGPGEGKSTVAANLGVVLAQANKRTLLMDCDFRKPVSHHIFGIPNVRGVVDIIVGEEDAHDVWQEPLTDLKVITAGPLPPNPAELMESERFAEFLRDVRHHFDYVLIDSSPVQLVSDPAIVGTQGDGVLLVFDAQQTRKEDVRQSVKTLETVGATVLGTVMNRFEVSHRGYTYSLAYR